LPLARGRLLVSRAQATFCRVDEPDVSAVEQALGGAPIAQSLAKDLERHGFFGAARQAEPETHTVQLQLTNACNLGCVYCCTNSGAPRKQELSRERWLALIDEIRASMGQGTRVSLLGGEPFLVPFAIEVAERIQEVGLDLGVFSNGLLFRDEALATRVAALVKRGANVRVSLAGASRESCDSLSGAARFDLAIEGVQRLAQLGARVTIDLMLSPQQADQIGRDLPRLRSLLPAGTPLALGVIFQGGRELGERVFSSRADLERALDAIAFEAGESIASVPASPVAFRRDGCSCALGHHLHARSDGALFTCFKMEERVGDLAVESFSEALARVRASPRPATLLEFCRECALATLCGGGCRAENIQLTGDPERPACGEWRLRVLAELLAEDRPSALEWPAMQLLREAQLRGIEAPEALVPARPSQHLLDT